MRKRYWGKTTDTLIWDLVNGDRVRCSVTAHDGEDAGNTASAEVIVGNTAPTVSDLTLSPLPLYANQGVSCTYTYDDADNQPDSSLLAWAIDGVSQTTGASTLNGFVGGQTVTCTVTANDRFEDGNTRSLTETVANTNPTVTNVLITPTSAVYAAPSLSCSYTWSDIDGNADNSTISWTVNGSPVGNGPTLTDNVFVSGDSVGCEVTPH